MQCLQGAGLSSKLEVFSCHRDATMDAGLCAPGGLTKALQDDANTRFCALVEAKSTRQFERGGQKAYRFPFSSKQVEMFQVSIAKRRTGFTSLVGLSPASL